MKPDELKAIVKEAMMETLVSMGIDADNPLEMQRDFLYTRKMRKGCEGVTSSVVKAIITATVPTALYLTWVAVKTIIKGSDQ